jgi:PAS domain S-box-containing protein
MIELLGRLLEFTGDGVYRYGLDDGRILSVNRGFVRLVGLECDPDELVGCKLSEFMTLPYRDGPGSEPPLGRTEVRGNELRFFTRSGEERWIVHDSAVVADDSGLRVVEGMMRDITDRKRKEHELEKAERRLRAVLAAVPDLMFQFDADGRFIDFYASTHAALYAPPEGFLGKHITEVLPPAVAAVGLDAIAAALRTGEVQVREYSLEIGGAPRYFEHRVAAISDSEVLSIVREITARKTAQDALAAEKERLHVTLTSIGDAVIATARDGAITLMNPVAEQMTGWPQAEAVGRPLSEVFHAFNLASREAVESPVQSVVDNGHAGMLAGDVALQARGGGECVVAGSAAPIRGENGSTIGVVLVLRDQSDKLRLHDEMLRAQKLESLGVLAGGIAHDFNNILTAVIGNLSLARSSIPASSPALHRLGDADKALARARSLTQQLVTFAKGGAPVRRPANLAPLVRDIARFALTGSSVVCEVNLAPELWAVQVDEAQIGQVIENMVINADQAMPDEGRITITLDNVLVDETSAHPVPAGPYVRMTVHDNGPGIPKRFLARIFDPYFTTKQKGSGLGLAISYSIVRSHKGAISVDSEPGSGTTFVVYLPALPGLQVAPAQESRSVRGTGRVLVMDDEELVRDVLGAMLSALGYEPVLTADGAAAVKEYEAAIKSGRRYDLVVLDLTVRAGMGGKDAVQQLRALDPRINALVSSGYSNDPVLSDYKRFGFSGVVSKPYRIEELSEALRDAMQGPR